jgi:hypothetical protein
MARLLPKDKLLGILDKVSNPRVHGLTQESLEQCVVDFCAGCPDPVQAYWLFTECTEPMSDEELVDRALSVPLVGISEVPLAIVPADHPARLIRRDA